MLTPLVMLALLTGPYLVARAAPRLAGRSDPRRAAALGLALMFAFTALGHFAQPGPMAEMLPPWIPGRILLVYLSGVLELALAAAFLVERWRTYAGWIAAALLIGFFPLNVYAALQRVPMGGHAWGPAYLLVRGPVQLAILLWVYWFTIRRAEH